MADHDTTEVARAVGDIAADQSLDITGHERRKLDAAAHIIAAAEPHDDEDQ